MLTLTHDELKELHGLITDAYATVDDLKLLTELHTGDRLEALVDVNKPLPVIVLDLIRFYNSRGDLLAFIQAVLKTRPNRSDIQAFLRRWLPNMEREIPAGELVQTTADAIGVIAELTADPKFRERTGRFHAHFGSIRVGIDTLTGYKKLHEILHVLQFQMPVILDTVERFPASQTRELLSRQRVLLTSQVARAMESSQVVHLREREEMWISDFESSVGFFGKSLDENNKDSLVESAISLRRFLTEASRIDGQMLAQVNAMPLNKATDVLRELLDTLEGVNVDAKSSIVAGWHALAILSSRLRSLTREHTLWQHLDTALAGIDSNSGFRPSEKVHRWKDQKSRLLRLCAGFPLAVWSKAIVGYIFAWEQAAAKGRSSECKMVAVSLRAQSMERFFDVDKQMHDLCGDFVKIGRPIESLLGIL